MNRSAKWQPVFLLIKDFCQAYSMKVLLVFALSLFNSITSGIGILLLIPLISSWLPSEQLQTTASSVTELYWQAANWIGLGTGLETILLSFLALIFMVGITNYLYTLYSSQLQQNFATQLRIRLFSRILNANWLILKTERTSNFIRLATQQPQIIASGVRHILSLMSQIILTLVYLIFSFSLSPALTGAALTGAVLLASSLFLLNQYVYQSSLKQLKATRSLYDHSIEQVNNLKLIKSTTKESYFLQNISDSSCAMERHTVQITRYNAIVRLINTIGVAVIFCLVFYSSLTWNSLPLATLVSLLVIFSRLMPQVSGLQSSYHHLLQIAPQYQDLLHQLEALNNHPEAAPSVRTTLDLKGSITLESIGFQYQATEPPIFENINACIHANTVVQITGRSGAGKSTLLDVISGLLLPSSGNLKVDGQVINAANQRDWRNRIAYITQDTQLINASIRDNLALLSCQQHSDAEINKALQLAHADGFVNKLPQGVDTIIGDKGTRLSGGQKQRVALARGLLLKPKLLILDEATNALDEKSQAEIHRVLQELKGSITMIIVSHDDTRLDFIDSKISL